MPPRHTDTVMFVAHVRYFGGSAVSLRSVLRHLDRGLRRVLAAPANGNVTPALIAEGLVDGHVAFRWPPRGRVRHAVAVIAAAARVASFALRHRGRVGAVHANGLVDAAIGAVAARVARAPLVTWVHDTDPVSRRSARLVPIVRALAGRSSWAAVSQASADALVDAGLVPRDEVAVVGNPIDIAPVTRHRQAGPVCVGYLGTDTLVKGFDLLPHVVRCLDGADIRLLVFARRHPGLSDELEQAWNTLAADPRVELVGRQDDVREAYERCDIVLCPSRAESFCRVAAEAMASGIPVVGASVPALRQLLGDDEAGVLFPTGDAAAAADVLRRVATDSNLRARLAAGGQTRARSFEGARIADRLAALYFPSSTRRGAEAG